MTDGARIIVYTGKGGVGKTSVAAATALLCAERGQRTLVISTDIAHSLADSFDLPLGGEPTPVAENLWGQEADVYYNVRRYWGTVQRYVQSVFKWRGLDDVLAEEMTVLPGMDELSSLLWIAEHHDSGKYDVIVVDAAPTGLVVSNRVLPKGAGAYFEAWHEAQRRYQPLVEESFAPVPVRSVPFFDREVVGLEMLRKLGQALFVNEDPARFFYRGRPYRVRRENGGYVLTLDLPFTSKEQVKVLRNGDELVLQVGSWRRNLVLPRALVEAPAKGAKFEGNTLRVDFAAPARD